MSPLKNGARNISLDGIRGIAIALVIFTHAFQGSIPSASRISVLISRMASSAWIGVDVFFVLSGYLITGILLKTREQDGYFRTFYMRRFFRIFPLYYSFLGVVFLISIFLPSWRAKNDLSWNLLYLSNVRIALHGWPWRPIGHLWSLAVEEQFYIVWPALIFIMPRRRTILSIAALFCLFLATRQWVGSAGASSLVIYSLLRLDGLLLGAVLAAIHRSVPASSRARHASWIVLLVSGAALVFHWLRVGDLDWEAWRGASYLNYSLIALCGAALIGVSVYSDRRAWCNRALAFSPLVQLGKYSYAIYLLHYPLDSVFRILHMHPAGVFGTIPYAIVLTGVSFVCALGTWNVLEEPCIKLKDRWFPYEPAPERQVPEPALA